MNEIHVSTREIRSALRTLEHEYNSSAVSVVVGLLESLLDAEEADSTVVVRFRP